MISIFFLSVVAGIILAAPFGPAGALVADSALMHDRRALEGTILGAVTGDTCLALAVSLAAVPIRDFLAEHEKLFFLFSGILILSIGLFLVVNGGRRSLAKKPHRKAPTRRGAPSLGVFLITLLHPGSIAAFVFLAGFFSLKFSSFGNNRLIFVLGIALGSVLAFAPMGILFWMIRGKAEKYILYLRSFLAFIVAAAGLYCLARAL
ncbi:MAG: hypothetical protein GF409_03540 [Candidatus Omnitrophica bacterium]|nr:hypothetical protein [Candidatus Omnitrophota bacterium]